MWNPGGTTLLHWLSRASSGGDPISGFLTLVSPFHLVEELRHDSIVQLGVPAFLPAPETPRAPVELQGSLPVPRDPHPLSFDDTVQTRQGSAAG